MSARADVVCLGEPLVAFVAHGDGPLRDATDFGVHVVGAESNVAVGLARLGVRSAFVGRRGEDPFGERIERALHAEGVATERLVPDPAPTGTLCRSVRPFGMSEVVYRRTGSAGSRLDERDVADARAPIAEAQWLHVSGISAVMSASGERAVRAAVAAARAAGTRVCVDVNLRERLRPLGEQRPLLLELAAQADLLLCGDDEGAALLGERDPSALARELRDFGAGTVVVKRGADGAIALAPDGTETVAPARRLERIVDPVGAGDAFAAGLLAALLAGEALGAGLEAGAICAAYAMSARGDVEGLPVPRELQFARERGERGTVR